MTSSSFVSPLDCLTSFLGISLSRAVSSFGLPVYSSIHSRRITKCPKIGHYSRVVFPKVAEAAGNARGVPNGPPPIRTLNPWVLFGRRDAAEHLKLTGGATAIRCARRCTFRPPYNLPSESDRTYQSLEIPCRVSRHRLS